MVLSRLSIKLSKQQIIHYFTTCTLDKEQKPLL
jgi:hypothetical protein